MSTRWGVVVSGYVAGVFGASKLGVPFGHLALATAAVVIIVALVVGSDLLDALTRRFQAATERMDKLGQCPSCRDPLPEKPVAPAEQRWWRRWWVRSRDRPDR